MPSAHPPPHGSQLKRELGVFGAVAMGLGSIIGTGIFVSVGIAAASAGASIILAIAMSAIVALCNGLSSAQLAAASPVSGGTYEYGYRWLHPSLGFTAGWMFLCAKSASAATAALGFAQYLLSFYHLSASWRIPLALTVVVIFTLLVLSGLRRSSGVNIVIVSISISALLLFSIAGLPLASENWRQHLLPLLPQNAASWRGLWEASALMFVAYTGYGRVATLGEEIRDPRRNIPLAMIVTLAVAMLLYMVVAAVAVGAVGAKEFATGSSNRAPLVAVAQRFDRPLVTLAVGIGAMAAMLGVLLNLLLGLSRVLLAMGRRRDVPALFAKLDSRGLTPAPAVIAVGTGIALLVLIDNVKTTWSFSAFTVLVYYALTNLAAIRLRPEERLYSPLIPWTGLAGCLLLAFQVTPTIWISGLILVAVGLTWWRVARTFKRTS